MNAEPLIQEQRSEIARAQVALDDLRRMRGVSDRGKILIQFEYCKEDIIARADGLGGALLTWEIVCGDDDVLVHREYHFDNEQDAYDSTEWLRGALKKSRITRSNFFNELNEVGWRLTFCPTPPRSKQPKFQ
jgi:hypothetical protein